MLIVCYILVLFLFCFHKVSLDGLQDTIVAISIPLVFRYSLHPTKKYRNLYLHTELLKTSLQRRRMSHFTI